MAAPLTDKQRNTKATQQSKSAQLGPISAQATGIVCVLYVETKYSDIPITETKSK